MSTTDDSRPPAGPDFDLPTLLLQGHEVIGRTAEAHAERWGLGRADRWDLDQAEGRIVWTFPGRTVSAPVQVLGSWNSRVGTFAWAWDNASVAEPLRRSSEQVRAAGVEHGVAALTSSPLVLDEEQVRDLVALAFRIVGGTGLYHPYDGTLATYLLFGTVTIDEGGRTTTFEVAADE